MIKFIIIVCLLPITVSCQVKIDSLLIIKNKEQWKKTFDSYFNLNVKDKINLEFYGNEKELPAIWDYEMSNACTVCRCYYTPIDDKSFFLIMHHSGEIGDYIFYFNKTITKSWSQINFVANNVIIKQVLNDIYYFKLTDFDEIEEQTVTRYIFVNAKTGRLSKKVLDIYGSELILQKINTNEHTIIFTVAQSEEKSKGVEIFDYKNMDFQLTDTTSGKTQKTYYRYLKSIKQ